MCYNIIIESKKRKEEELFMDMDIEKAANLSAFLQMNKNLQDYCVSKNWRGFIEKVESFIEAVRISQKMVVKKLYLEIVLFSTNERVSRNRCFP